MEGGGRSDSTEDTITDLPEEILHKILAFLGAKDAVRTKILSKSWGSVWASFPILDFNETFWTSRKDFIDYVDNIQQQWSRSEMSIKKFRLSMKEVSFRDFDIFSHLDSWINSATKGNLEELALNMSVGTSFENLKFFRSLPQSIFTTESLIVLKLRRCKLGPSHDVKLPRLKTLALEEIDAEAGIIQNLVSNCPLVETLILNRCSGLNMFDINKPNLQYFSFSLTLHDIHNNLFDGKFEINAERLKYLSLQGLRITDKRFHDLISKFPLLENLRVLWCILPKKLDFYTEKLTSFVVYYCWNLVEVWIDAPKLIWFNYTGSILKISLMNTSCKLHVRLCIEPIVVDSRWFSELKEILVRFGHAQILTIYCKATKIERFIIPREFREISLPPLLDLKHLQLKTTSEPMMNYEELIDSLLWIAPNIETLSIDNGSTCKTLKFQPKDLLVEWEGGNFYKLFLHRKISIEGTVKEPKGKPSIGLCGII